MRAAVTMGRARWHARDWWQAFIRPSTEKGDGLLLMTPPHTPVDVARLSFPVQLVILIVTTSLTIAGSVWVAQAGLKSDVRDIMTRMEAQREIEATRAENVREALDAFRRRQELQQYEIQGLKEAIMKLQSQRGTAP